MDIDLSVLKFIEREKEIPFGELVSIIEAAILAAYQNEARRCDTQSNISIWMPWDAQHTNNRSYLESFAELGVDRVIFLTTEAQHFNEIKQLGNFSFP